jgi:UDP-2,3-diacylglucosamine pyrophosphatase LpxH
METGTEEYLLSIWGTSDDNIFVVGDNSSILHFDGKAWSKINPIKEEYFTKVKGLGKDCVYVAGENGTVLRYDGTCWNDMSL